MPPKSAKKKTTSKTAQPISTDLTATDQVTLLTQKCSIYERELHFSRDIITRLKEAQIKTKQQVDEINENARIKEIERIQLISDMSRQFKTMQSFMIEKQNILENEVVELKNSLNIEISRRENQEREYSIMIRDKEVQLEDNMVKMSYMSNEFEQMLNDTLSKITRRIENVSEASQKRLNDFQVSKILLK